LIALIAFIQLTLSPLGRRFEGRQATDAGGARGFAWLAALLSLVSVSILGAAMAATAEASELLLLFGLVPWARYGAWIGLLAGLLGLLTVVTAFRARMRYFLPVTTLLGFLLTGAAAVGLGAFLLAWDLGPL
jgi:hypothetical protein